MLSRWGLKDEVLRSPTAKAMPPAVPIRCSACTCKKKMRPATFRRVRPRRGDAGDLGRGRQPPGVVAEGGNLGNPPRPRVGVQRAGAALRTTGGNIPGHAALFRSTPG